MSQAETNDNKASGKALDISTGSRLAELCRDLFDMLDACEVSDSGREFHPTTIQSCRAMHCAKLAEILPEMKKLSFENMEARHD